MADELQLAENYLNEGLTCLKNNQAEDGLENLRQAHNMFFTNEAYPQLIKTQHYISLAYGLLQKDSDMTSSLIKGLRYCDNFGINGARHLFFNSICDRYLSLGDYDNAINYGLLAVQDIEEYGDQFDNDTALMGVAYLNLAYAYLKAHDFNKAQTNIDKSMEIYHSADIHYHDYTCSCMTATIHHMQGDDDYVMANLDTLMNFFRNVNVTVEDYIQDIQILVELLCDMGFYDKALFVAQSLQNSSISVFDSLAGLEIIKLLMSIYQKNGDRDSYIACCENYVHTDKKIKESERQRKLSDMDTTIALMLAGLTDLI